MRYSPLAIRLFAERRLHLAAHLHGEIVLVAGDVAPPQTFALRDIALEPHVVLVDPRPRGPFQGWRYFEEERVPPDLSTGDTADMPAEMAAELKRLGLL